MTKSNTGTGTVTDTTICIHACIRSRPLPRRRRSSILLAVIFLSSCLVAFHQLSVAHSQSHSYSQPDTYPHSHSHLHSHSAQSLVNDLQRPHQRPQRPHPSIPAQAQAQLPRRTDSDNNSTFSACLLVADDNHYLIEWLAFHYHTLPLRYLVITSDPRARTTPDLILDRWKPYMTIVQWSDQDFLPPHWLNRIPPEHDPIAKLTKHRERQRHFYPACFQFLKQAGRQWVMVIDVDEFALHNTHYNGTRYAFDYNTSTVTTDGTTTNAIQSTPKHHTPTSTSIASTTTSATATILQAIQYYYPFPNISCITIPRLRFGNFETNATRSQTQTNNRENNPSNYGYNLHQRTAPPGFNDNNFLTYRFRWRAALSSRTDNKPPKSTIHVGRISNFSRQDTDAHRPVRSACPRNQLYTLPQDSPFVIHHYVGTDQQFRFRNDARDGTKTRSDNQLLIYNRIRHAYDQSACSWITSFVEQMGNDTAQLLLEGVGDVTYSLYL